jgi:flagellar P-ring protein precursor FlgI
MKIIYKLLLISLFNIIFIIQSHAQIIKDFTSIVGIRDNSLIGYGLVVGLAGSGDKSKFTMQSLQNLLQNSYIKTKNGSIKSKNVAAVMVTAILPPFARQGDKITVKISAIGDAKSIDHGSLILTQLKGVDGKIYALAQGTIIANVDNATTGYIYGGAVVENEVGYRLKDEKYIVLSLKRNDAKSAFLVQEAVNARFESNIASALDTRTIKIDRPSKYSMVHFISVVENIDIGTNIKPKIIIDMNKGLLVAGHNIEIKPVVVAMKDFTLRIKKFDLEEKDFDDQVKNPGNDIGDGVIVGNKPEKINLNNALINTQKRPIVGDLIRAMKLMKLDINDIIDTIKLLKELGAINADIEIKG